MKICYIDEAGCTGTLPATNVDIQPTLVIGGIIIDYSKLHYLTEQLLNLKRRFYPKSGSGEFMGYILEEIKGADVRRKVCSNSRNERRHANGFLRKIIELCQEVDAKLVGRVWIKSIGKPVKGTSIYTYSIQSIYTSFQKYLSLNGDFGIVIADSRVHHLNQQVAHSIFTQKFKGSGDSFDRIIELPAFSHSNNHAGLQIIDLICSALVTPIAIETYCKGHVTNLHVKPAYSRVKADYAESCRKLQFRYSEASGKKLGGLIISDGIGNRSGSLMFRPSSVGYSVGQEEL